MHPFPSCWKCRLLMADSCPFSGQLILNKRSSPTWKLRHQPLWAANNQGQKDKLPVKCRKSSVVQSMLQNSCGIRLSLTPAETIHLRGSFPYPSLLSYLRALPQQITPVNDHLFLLDIPKSNNHQNLKLEAPISACFTKFLKP